MSTFENLGLNAPLVKTLNQLGYESPTPIQAEAIPVFLKGGDLIAQAQTGTGKTAAFALPIVHGIDLEINKPQALILAPTRELAIQVAEALKSYAKHIPSFHVLPIYGGQEYRVQLSALRRGVHVVVGTPGRVMDHMRRETLQLDALRTFVLDEADEMLKMGFIDDIQWILDNLPTERQIALFSATMPPAIQKVASKHLRDATKIHIASKTKTVELVEQRAVLVTQYNKLEALTRFLETEKYDASIIFARTKVETIELVEKLSARGYSVDALNGDVRQVVREKVIHQLKNKTLDIVVATEVAARGLDVERIDLVINYDIPMDAESYVHRVGRTGRAGRIGKAISFVTPREQGLLYSIERTINAKIEFLQVPSLKQMHAKRVGNLSKKILDTLSVGNLQSYRELIESMIQDGEHSAVDIASALAFLLEGDTLLQQDMHDALSMPVRTERNDQYNDRPSGQRRRSGSGQRQGQGQGRGDGEQRRSSGGGGFPPRRSSGGPRSSEGPRSSDSRRGPSRDRDRSRNK